MFAKKVRCFTIEVEVDLEDPNFMMPFLAEADIAARISGTTTEKIASKQIRVERKNSDG